MIFYSQTNMKRAVAKITVYVYASSEEELIKESELLCDKINQLDSDYVAETEELFERPFGKIGVHKEIKLDK